MSAYRVILGLGLVVASGCGAEPREVESGSFALRPDDPAAPIGEPRFDANETVERFDSPGGRIRVHFTRAGRNAVPPADNDSSGTPDYVELVARSYDEVRASYHQTHGFREPVSDALLGGLRDGGDDRFDVYLVDFGGRGDGAYRRDACQLQMPSICAGHMLQENDFAGYGYPSLALATRVLASHEYFHAVQSAYDADQDVVFSEGTAVWATEKFDPTLSDFEGFVRAFLERTDRPLNVVSGGVVDAKSYGTALFFQFLDEYYGGEIVRALMEATEDGAHGVADPNWFTELDPFLARERGSSFAEALRTFSIWNLYTLDRNDPTKAYANARSYPRVTMEQIGLPLSLDRPRYFQASTKYYAAPPGGRSELTAALVVPPGQEAELADVTLILSALTVSLVRAPLQLADPTAGTETLNTTGVDQALLMVVNTAQEGPSRRPSVCWGTPAEVVACREQILGSTAPDAGTEVSEDAGDSDLGAAPGADAGVADTGVMEDGGGGCASLSPGAASPVFLLGLFFVAQLRRRARAWNRPV